MRLPRLGWAGLVIVVAAASVTAALLMKKPLPRREKLKGRVDLDDVEPNPQGTIVLRRYKRDGGNESITRQILRSVIQELKDE